jgi:hypothetical protein
MSERTYNRLANTSMLIAIVSALLFDSGKFPHVVVGTIGILAGVAALALYFCNQREVSEKKELSQPQQEGAVAELEAVEGKAIQGTTQGVHFLTQGVHFRLMADEARAVGVGDLWQIAIANNALQAYTRRRAAEAWLAHYSDDYAPNLRWSAAKGDSRVLMQPEVELSPKQVAACAVEIMRNLAILDELNGEWEYSFGAKGLRVSLKKTHSARLSVPQEDFDFGNISSMIQ